MVCIDINSTSGIQSLTRKIFNYTAHLWPNFERGRSVTDQEGTRITDTTVLVSKA